MLEQIHIKNVALIEESEIHFAQGLNILSGETGAGKSMVIDSINFVLGERTTRDFLRKGAPMASVEALFVSKEKGIQSVLFDEGIPVEDDGAVLITRTINSQGKSVCRVNGSIVTAGMLKRLSESLIDIHGQHEHQSLLNASKHCGLLDRLCGEVLNGKKNELNTLYENYLALKKNISRFTGGERERAHRVDLIQFQIEEITNAALRPKEEEELILKRKILANAEKRGRFANEVLEVLYRGRMEGLSATDQLSTAVSLMGELSVLDENVNHLYDIIDTVYVQLEDAVREIQKYAGSIELNTEELNHTEERLQLIYILKKKYGNSVEEILEYCEKINQELEEIKASETIVQSLLKEKYVLEEDIKKLCGEISSIRRKYAFDVQTLIEKQLQELEMKNAAFQIAIESKEEFTANGWDKVEFMISPNKGEELKPLSKIASGGEMSRVMLALKTVLAQVDTIETFIFDEIDTGVSGRTAQKVAEKLSVIGLTHQILCITHLPQIAAMADQHFLIEKSADEFKTTTTVKALDEKMIIEEIARLLGGAKITKATYEAAAEMKQLAQQLKVN